MALAILFGIFAVGIVAILRANFYYQDDSGRVVYGYKQWDYFGRFLSTALATIVHADNYLADAAPLPQLLSMLILAFSGILILYTVFGRTRFSLWEVIAVIPVGLNPFMLECISFRYDAPYMACSVLCAVAPLLFREKRKSNYLFAIALGTVGVCTSYQPATGIFPMLVVFLALRMWNEGTSGKKVGEFILKSAVGYLLGLIFFVVALMRPTTAGYVSSEIPAVSGLLPNTINNLRLYYGIVFSDLKTFWLALGGVLAVGFVVASSHGAKDPGFRARLQLWRRWC